MAVLYGFHRYAASSDSAVEEAAKASYALLDDSQKQFFHGTLPALLVATGIGAINTSTIAVMARRWMRLVPMDGPRMAEKTGDNPYKALEAYLEPFIGVTSNVCFETDAEFNARVPEYGPPFGAKEVLAAQRAKRMKATA